MHIYTEQEIIIIHREFRAIKRYKDKLSFFDIKFTVIPFLFPPFSPDLPILFNHEITNRLIGILKNERKNPMLTKKIFSFSDRTYEFDIKPTNSNCIAYNNFIISKFLEVSDQLDKIAKECMTNINSDQTAVKKIIENLEKIIIHIEYTLANGYDKSLQYYFMNVFYKGLSDARWNKIKPSHKKKKFTILYLYTQGVLYAQLIITIKELFEENTKTEVFG